DWMHAHYNKHVPGWTWNSLLNRSGLEGTNWGTAWYAYSADVVKSMALALQQEAISRGEGSSATFYYSQATNYAALGVAVRQAYTNLSSLGWIKYDHNNHITNIFYNTQ